MGGVRRVEGLMLLGMRRRFFERESEFEANLYTAAKKVGHKSHPSPAEWILPIRSPR